MATNKKMQKRTRSKKSRLKKENKKIASIVKKKKYESKFPEIVFDNEFCKFIDAEFVKIVKEIIKAIKFDNKNYFPKWQQRFFIEAKRNGINNVHDFEELLAGVVEGVLPTEIADFEIFHNYGCIVFQELNKRNLCDRYIPYQFFSFYPLGETCRIRFECLYKEKSKFGTIYYSPLMPKVSIEGRERIVGFSRHAIERIIKRTLYSNKTYVGSGELRKLLINNKYFETNCYQGKYLLTFYDWGFDWPNHSEKYTNIIEKLAQYILQTNYDQTKCYYYKVGYMPIGLSEQFASGITLLLPGMKGTPEYDLVRSSLFTFEEKESLSNNLKDLPGIAEQFKLTTNVEFLKFFHNNGIPQIKSFDQELYLF